MSLLKARLLASERAKQQSEQAQSRKLQVGSGDRSERIRTYNFPQGRVTDHRINLTLYKLDDVMSGNLDELIGALNQEHQAEELAQQVDCRPWIQPEVRLKPLSPRGSTSHRPIAPPSRPA